MIKKIFGLLLAVILLTGVAPAVQEPQEIRVPGEFGVDLEGDTFSLNDYLGKENLYLVFWATWCPACEDEIPNLIDTHNNVKEVKLVAVNPGINDSFARTRVYAEKMNLPYTIVFDQTGLSAQAFGVFGIPTAVLINKDEEVVYMGYPLRSHQISKILE